MRIILNYSPGKPAASGTLANTTMASFSFIDFGLKDFIRTDDGEVLIKDFPNYQAADNFIADGGLDEYGWTNKGTRKWCWEAESHEEEVD